MSKQQDEKATSDARHHHPAREKAELAVDHGTKEFRKKG